MTASQFIEGVITCLVLLDGHKSPFVVSILSSSFSLAVPQLLPAWLLALTWRGLQQRPRLSWGLQNTWTHLSCRGSGVQDLAPFSIWPEQSGRGIPSFELAESRWQQTVARLVQHLKLGSTQQLKSIDLSVSKTITFSMYPWGSTGQSKEIQKLLKLDSRRNGTRVYFCRQNEIRWNGLTPIFTSYNIQVYINLYVLSMWLLTTLFTLLSVLR